MLVMMSFGSLLMVSWKVSGVGGYCYVWKENCWRVLLVKNGLNIGGDFSCWIS